MGRRKKSEVATRDAPVGPVITSSDSGKDTEAPPTRVYPVSAPAPLSDASGDIRQKEPVYRVVKGALSTLSGIIDSETVVEDGNEPGQVLPWYFTEGLATIQKWVKAGFIEVK